ASCYRAMGQLKRAAAHYNHLKERAAYATRALKALEEIEAQLSVAAKEPAASAGSADAEAPATSSNVGASPKTDSEKAAGESAGQPAPGTVPNSPAAEAGSD